MSARMLARDDRLRGTFGDCSSSSGGFVRAELEGWLAMTARSWFQSFRSNAFLAVELRVLPSMAPPNAFARRLRPATSRCPGRVLLRVGARGGAEAGAAEEDAVGNGVAAGTGELPPAPASGEAGKSIEPPPRARPRGGRCSVGADSSASASLTGLCSGSLAEPEPPRLLNNPPVESKFAFDEKGVRWKDRRGRKMWVCGDGDGEGPGRKPSMFDRSATTARRQFEICSSAHFESGLSVHPVKGVRTAVFADREVVCRSERVRGGGGVGCWVRAGVPPGGSSRGGEAHWVQEGRVKQCTSCELLWRVTAV